MGKRVGIVQSSYIPWKGYFDLIAAVDEFILLDDVQYTRRDWRNRNRIKGPQGPAWLTVPVETKGRFEQRICDTRVADSKWGERHWRMIRQFYAATAHFSDHYDWLEDLFLGCAHERLSQVNHRFLTAICSRLGIETSFTWSMDYAVNEKSSARIQALCERAGATAYLSGPSAASYLDLPSFDRAGITVEWMDYSGYPEYRQQFPPFEHQVSVLDLMLNEGSGARRFMKEPW